MPAAAWLAHASVDWLWELPAVTAPAFALLGLVAGLGVATGARGAPARRRPARTAAVAVLVGLAAASYALPALAAREIERAVSVWDDDPAAAWRGLDRARTLDPLGDRADVIAGVLARRDGDLGRARQAFARAVARDPDDWYAQTELALVELGEGAPRRGGGPARRRGPAEPARAGDRGGEGRGAAGTPAPASVEQRLAEKTVPGADRTAIRRLPAAVRAGHAVRGRRRDDRRRRTPSRPPAEAAASGRRGARARARPCRSA